jgi:hypothetical protein
MVLLNTTASRTRRQTVLNLRRVLRVVAVLTIAESLGIEFRGWIGGGLSPEGSGGGRDQSSLAPRGRTLRMTLSPGGSPGMG